MQEKQTLRPFPEAMLNPRLDPIFKSLFTQSTDDSANALKAFLSAILEQDISELTLDPNELPIESEKDKQSIFDLTCRTACGKKI